MKNLTKIEPEPEHEEFIELKWMRDSLTNGLNVSGLNKAVRVLIHKVNELTDEINRIKADKK